MDRIQEWRNDVKDLDFCEAHHRKEGYLPTDRISGDVRTKSWWVTLRPEMAPDVRRKVEDLSEKPIPTRHGQMSKLIEYDITRVHRQTLRRGNVTIRFTTALPR